MSEKITDYLPETEILAQLESGTGGRAMSKFPGNAVEPFGWIDIHDQKPKIGTEIIGMYAYGSIARFLVESHGSYRKDFTAEYCKVDYWLPMPELPEEYR